MDDSDLPASSCNRKIDQALTVPHQVIVESTKKRSIFHPAVETGPLNFSGLIQKATHLFKFLETIPVKPNASRNETLSRLAQAVNDNQRQARHQQVAGVIHRPIHVRHLVDRNRHSDFATLGIDESNATPQVIEGAVFARHRHVGNGAPDCITRRSLT